MTSDYESFLATKLATIPPAGIDCARVESTHLFEFQKDLVTWALRRGRCALFASTGLGKSRMQVTWADHVQRHTGGRVLILAPLSVARQTAAEGVTIGIDVRRVSDITECAAPGIYITNYDKLHKFGPFQQVADNGGVATLDFDAVVLDESSIVKSFASKLLGSMLDRFASTPFRLACSATPSPNDYTELGTHAEFLGICTRAEMLAEYFTHDAGNTSVWRLKRHARQAFWKWVASWAAMVRKPSDLGYDDAGYVLPPLHVQEHLIETAQEKVFESGFLFAEPVSMLSDRRRARKMSMNERVGACVEQVQAEPNEQFVVWCELNAEQDAIKSALGDECVSIAGANSPIEKEMLHENWISGRSRVLATKGSIFGWGLNWQHCARMAFVGVGDSWERYHQCTKRIHRFGQKRECRVHIFYSDLEGNVLANLKRKEEDAIKMGDELSVETRDVVRAEVVGTRRHNPYEPARIEMPAWLTRRDADA